MTTLQELRKKASMTQLQLAEASALAWSTIQKLEYGEFLPSWDTVQKLQQVLGPEVLQIDFKTRMPQKKRGRKPNMQTKKDE